MSKMLLVPFLALVQIAAVLASGPAASGHAPGPVHDWDYDASEGRENPSGWHKKYPNCAGKRQSPINLVDQAIKQDKTLKPIQFINYDKPVTGLLMENDGHTIKVTLPQSADLRISTPSLPAQYKLSQFHFHWPAEHMVNGERFPMELHLVHANTKLPANETTVNPAGLVVVAVFFDFRQPDEIPNTLRTIISNTVSTAKEGQKVTINAGLTLDDLLPEDKSYIRYSGSLTTPGCAEVVEFHIMTNTLRISAIDVLRFHSLRHEIEVDSEKAETKIRHNDRPAQALNGRTLHLFGDMGDLPTDF